MPTSSNHSIMDRNQNKKTHKIVKIMILAILAIIIIGSISVFFHIKSALSPVDSDSTERITVSIPIGSSTNEIGKILEEHKVINDGRIFRFYTRIKKESGFQAGDYVLSPSMELHEIISSLQSGVSPLGSIYKVTVPEGKTIEEIAEIYAEKLPFTDDEFLQVVNDEQFIQQMMEKYPELLTDDILQDGIRMPLEGYLYAATYEINEENPKVESIIEQMIAKSNEIILPYMDQMKEQDISIHEAVTFASIIEKETGTLEQRKEIAGVFYNRLAEGMKLQTDPTVLYALGKHKEKVLYEDLKIKSPYNTYVIDTLPIGPISNFGDHALDASLNPTPTDHLYFLHDQNGEIYFSKTYDEHIKNKNKYIK